MKLRLPPSIAYGVRLAEQAGHELVSQGCGLFRCVRCGRHAFLDEGHTMGLCTPLDKPKTTRYNRSRSSPKETK